jgi:hypothetical protein
MKSLLLVLVVLAFTKAVYSEGLNFSGYIQPYFLHFESAQTYGSGHIYNSGGLSQANFIIQGDFDKNFSALVNFELLNNFSADKGWGTLNLQEAYLKWEHNNYLVIKFGQILPQFNNLNEIYYKTTELPYILRPRLYEATLGNLVDIFDILPQKALIQISGDAPISDNIKLDYAGYINHAINKFHSNQNNDLLPSYVPYGQSAESYLGYGGRIGIHTGSLKAGVSAAADVSNQRKFKWTEAGNLADLGDMGRMKLGADLSFKIYGFTFAGEVLACNTTIPDKNVTIKNIYNNNQDTVMKIKDFLDYANKKDKMFIGTGFDRLFYYVSLKYNPTEDIFVYFMYDYLDDKIDPYYFGTEGYKGFSIGAGWNVTKNIVLKAQFQRNNAKYENTFDNINYTLSDYHETFIAAGVSISL